MRLDSSGFNSCYFDRNSDSSHYKCNLSKISVILFIRRSPKLALFMFSRKLSVIFSVKCSAVSSQCGQFCWTKASADHMLILSSYYSEVRQHLRGVKRHGHHVDRHRSSLTQHGGKLRLLHVCVCVFYMCNRQSVRLYHTVSRVLVSMTAAPVRRVCAADGVTSQQTLCRRDGGATSGAQLRGNPWHGVSY